MAAVTTSPFALCKIRQPISLLPCHIAEPRLGIDQEMTALLMRYSEKLKGVILSFSNVQLEKSAGQIMNEQPYIHCKVLADALVFQPREGMKLEGVVNKIGSNHIGVLFAGVFNGSVAASELPKDYVHNYAKDSWIGADGSTIAAGDKVEVKVLRVHVAGGMIAIEASMRGTSKKPATKKQQRRASVDVTAPVGDKKKLKTTSAKKDAAAEPPVVSKKRKKAEKKPESADVAAVEEDKKSKKKKSKKIKKEE